jgi:hypothetical protein
MAEYGCFIAFDSGGGGDVTEVINGVLTNVPENPNGAQRGLPQFLAMYTKESGGSMPTNNGTAKEILGKSPSVRSSPEVASGNKIGSLPAGVTIEFVSIVDDLSNPVNKWFKRPDNTYVNYVIDGRNYFQVLNMPTTDPEPTPTGNPAHIALELAAGSTVTVYDDDGNELWKGTA